ncbi:MAG TPA: NAD-dependent epimerase/dehydratase family protein [Planctomycetes bacterium]|nr:NAD-dependent epimerase/dehydratase family protein [Planctomycetota bacterium]
MENSVKPVIEGKRILVIGGTGSLGRALVARLLGGGIGVPAKVIVFSRDEAKQHAMRVQYSGSGAGRVASGPGPGRLELRLGDVRRFDDVAAAVRDADLVINAAGLKQVPSCEYFPEQALLTNCLGPVNIVRAIRETGTAVKVVVGVSTDKACQPVNVMGMTKAVHERVFAAANLSCPATRFVLTRYGNVLGSRGSVIPLFCQQIRQGGPVTVTAPEMTRFLMSLDQAVDCVLAALGWGGPGEVIVPRIPSATMLNVVKALVGQRNVEIRITGPRPGEKVHEVLICEQEAARTVRRGDYYAIRPLLPELYQPGGDEPVALQGPYSSAHGLLSLDQTRQLLDQHRMLPEQWERSGGENLFSRLAA